MGHLSINRPPPITVGEVDRLHGRSRLGNATLTSVGSPPRRTTPVAPVGVFTVGDGMSVSPFDPVPLFLTLRDSGPARYNGLSWTG